MQSGDRVNVYEDPISHRVLDGPAQVLRSPKPLGWTDRSGRRMYRALVRYEDKTVRGEYLMDVSEVVNG
jgi:hypothetical protein